MAEEQSACNTEVHAVKTFAPASAVFAFLSSSSSQRSCRWASLVFMMTMSMARKLVVAAEVIVVAVVAAVLGEYEA